MAKPKLRLLRHAQRRSLACTAARTRNRHRLSRSLRLRRNRKRSGCPAIHNGNTRRNRRHCRIRR